MRKEMRKKQENYGAQNKARYINTLRKRTPKKEDTGLKKCYYYM